MSLMTIVRISLFFGIGVLVAALRAQPGVATSPPADGFQALYDGHSFAGWRGRPHLDPRVEATWDDATREAKRAEWERDREEHWSIDPATGELVSDGDGVFLTTENEYGDFELIVDWKMGANGDSGIYLRGSPQVQIWDPKNEEDHKHGSQRGSGALWNNGEDDPGKWPLELADNAIGDWNRFRIKMIGARVWVWLNERPTVVGAIMDNYWDRDLPMFRRGVIQLQTHGSEIRFRNIRIRQISAAEANRVLSDLAAGGMSLIFHGSSWDGWSGPTEENAIQDGAIVSSHGTIYTDQEWDDFAVQFEFQLPPAGNNGLAIRYPGSGDTAYEGMCEIQTLDSTSPEYAAADPRQHHGSAYGMVAAARGYLRTPGEWNFERVLVRGSRITVELNGTIILDTDLADVTEYLDDQPHPGKDRRKGHFGFAGHGAGVRYRNIRAKSL